MHRRLHLVFEPSHSFRDSTICLFPAPYRYCVPILVLHVCSVPVHFFRKAIVHKLPNGTTRVHQLFVCARQILQNKLVFKCFIFGAAIPEMHNSLVPVQPIQLATQPTNEHCKWVSLPRTGICYQGYTVNSAKSPMPMSGLQIKICNGPTSETFLTVCRVGSLHSAIYYLKPLFKRCC